MEKFENLTEKIEKTYENFEIFYACLNKFYFQIVQHFVRISMILITFKTKLAVDRFFFFRNNGFEPCRATIGFSESYRKLFLRLFTAITPPGLGQQLEWRFADSPADTSINEAARRPGDHGDEYKMVCYFTNWAWYRQNGGRYVPEDIDPDLCTHVIYGFAILDGSNLTVKAHDSWADIDNSEFQGNFLARIRFFSAREPWKICNIYFLILLFFFILYLFFDRILQKSCGV